MRYRRPRASHLQTRGDGKEIEPGAGAIDKLAYLPGTIAVLWVAENAKRSVSSYGLHIRP